MGQKVSCCVCRNDSETTNATVHGKDAGQPAATSAGTSKVPEAAPEGAIESRSRGADCCGSNGECLAGDRRAGSNGEHNEPDVPQAIGGKRPKTAALCSFDVPTKSARHCGHIDDPDEGERPRRDMKAASPRSKLGPPREKQRPAQAVDFAQRDGMYCSIACVSSRNTATQSPVLREALSGNRALQAKQLEIGALMQKMEALMQVRTQIATRVQDDASMSPPKNLLEVNGEAQLLCRDDWVDRILKYEPAMHGVHAKMVNEACADQLGGTNRLIDAQEVDLHYSDLVRTVDERTQQRISVINAELQKLDAEVVEIEDLIDELYERMVDHEGDVIKKDRFIVVMCEEVGEAESGSEVCPKDAEHLFNHMSKGQQVLTFDQLKAELPHGCLVVVRGNVEDRRNKAKQYRNGWI